MSKRLTISVDGANGVNGSDGWSGSSGSYGGDGSDGTDAGPASRGADAGGISLRLSSSGDGAGYAFDGVAGAISGLQQAEATTDLLLTARGGRGGDGGTGGRGGSGGTGHSGRDATRYSNGTDGGRGGDGGDGGRGSHGGDGGAGGDIHVRVHERDAYLLMAIEGAEQPEAYIEGGDGGHKGHHGSGGSGGSGGRGGSSYSWTETESYTDSQGNRQTRSTRHSNPGGSSGWSGSSGRTPSSPLYDGTDGRDGSFRLEVQRDIGSDLVTSRRYDLRLESFDFREESTADSDGILEFGEIVEVSALCLRNVGELPTPPHQRVRLTLREKTWLRPVGDELFLPESLAPGDAVTLDGILRFQIPRPEITEPGDALVVKEVIAPAADQLGPERAGVSTSETPFIRRYGTVDMGRSFEARFPIENVTGVRALRSLAPGERTRIFFQVDNISLIDVGHESPRKRRVRVQLELTGGDVDPSQLVFRDNEGVEHALVDTEEADSGFVFDIPLIPAQGNAVVEGEVGFIRGVPPYVGATLIYTIWLESLAHDGALEVVQRRELTLRAEPGYAATPGSRIVMLTNDGLTREAYLGWTALLDERVELPADEWSLARYGHFEHEEIMQDGNTLRGHLEDKLVLVLNNHFHPRSTEDQELPTSYLRGRDFREAATQQATRTLIVGSNDFAIKEWLEPTSLLRSGGDDYGTLGLYFDHVRNIEGTLSEDTFGTDITTLYDEITVQRHSWPFFRPGFHVLTKIAHKVQKRLAKIHPHHRYIVVYRDEDIVKLGRTLGMIPKWHLGRLQVRRSLNFDTNTAVHLHMDDEVMLRPTAIFGEHMRFALMLALSFESKLDRLGWLMKLPDHLDADQQVTARALVAAILVDLAEEQAALRRSSAELTEENMELRLSHLTRLCAEPLMTAVDADSNKWEHLFALSAGIDAMVRSQTSWWLFFGRQRRITKYTQAALERFNYDTFASYAIDADGDVAMGIGTAREVIAPRVKVLLKSVRVMISIWTRIFIPWRARRLALEHMQHPDPIGRLIHREIDAWSEPDQRVWAFNELERAMRDERWRLAGQKALRQANEADRAEMLVGSEVGETEVVEEAEAEAAA